MTEFEKPGIKSVSENWSRMTTEQRTALLRSFAPLFRATYGYFESPQYDHLALQQTPDGLTHNIRSHLFMAVTPQGFSVDEAQRELEDYANSDQG